MRVDTSLAKLGRLDQDTLCVVVEAFRLIDESRRPTHEVPRLMHQLQRLNVEPQRLVEQARALCDEAKRLVREALGIMHEVQKLDLDAKNMSQSRRSHCCWVKSTLTPVFVSGRRDELYADRAQCRRLPDRRVPPKPRMDHWDRMPRPQQA